MSKFEVLSAAAPGGCKGVRREVGGVAVAVVRSSLSGAFLGTIGTNEGRKV